MFRSRGRSRWTVDRTAQLPAHPQQPCLCHSHEAVSALPGPGATLGPRGSYKVAVSHTIKNSVLRKDVRAAAVPQTQEAPDHRPAAGQNVPGREKPGFVLYRGGKVLLRLGTSRSEPGSRLTPSGRFAEEGLMPRKQAQSFGFSCHLLDPPGSPPQGHPEAGASQNPKC